MKKARGWRVFAILLLWLWFGGVTLIVHLVRTGDPSSKFPVDAMMGFVDLPQLIILLVAGLAAFMLFALVGHKSTSPDDRARARFFAGLTLDELGSAAVHFGALLLVCFAFSWSAMYAIGGLAFGAIGAWLMEPE